MPLYGSRQTKRAMTIAHHFRGERRQRRSDQPRWPARQHDRCPQRPPGGSWAARTAGLLCITWGHARQQGRPGPGRAAPAMWTSPGHEGQAGFRVDWSRALTLVRAGRSWVGVLDGIRVLDFGRFIAGPYCAALLADLGADVIRVERVGGGEDLWVTPVTSDGVGSIYLQCNRGKRALTLDPSAADGRAVVARLVAQSDAVVANLPPATLAAMGLSYESLREINPA